MVAPIGETPAVPLASGAFIQAAHRTLWSDAFRRFRRHRLAMLGLVVFCSFLVTTIIGPLIYSPVQASLIAQNHG